jgi:hypothetical protein
VVRIAISGRFRADFFGYVVSTHDQALLNRRAPSPSSQIPFDCHSTRPWAECWCDFEAMNFDKKDEDSGAVFHLDKTQVFQDARAFNASPIQPKKCRIILTKIKCTPCRHIAQWGVCRQAADSVCQVCWIVERCGALARPLSYSSESPNCFSIKMYHDSWDGMGWDC